MSSVGEQRAVPRAPDDEIVLVALTLDGAEALLKLATLLLVADGREHLEDARRALGHAVFGARVDLDPVDVEPPEDPEPYPDDMPLQDVIAHCREAGIPVNGTKRDLIAILRGVAV